LPDIKDKVALVTTAPAGTLDTVKDQA
jgi:hypothetical protein